MTRPDYANLAGKRIAGYEDGSVFGLSDFADITDAKTMHMILTRMCDKGIVRKIMRGIYMKPKYSELLQEYVEPRINLIAAAIARNYGWNIVPSGVTALNLLGLSTQVPAHYEFISDGPYKTYTYNGIDIVFKHTNKNTEITQVSHDTAIIIQAIKALGKGNITSRDMRILAYAISGFDKQQLKKEALHCTAWVYETIKTICGEEMNV